MQPLNEYLTGRRDKLSRRDLDRLIERHEWFTTARRARALLTGDKDPALTLPLGFWPTVPPAPQKKREKSAQETVPEAHNAENTVAAELYPETAGPTEGISTEERVIDRFLEHGGYRIVPAGDDGDAENALAAGFPGDTDDADPDLVTEELAEIYRAQGLTDKADEIYRRIKGRLI